MPWRGLSGVNETQEKLLKSNYLKCQFGPFTCDLKSFLTERKPAVHPSSPLLSPPLHLHACPPFALQQHHRGFVIYYLLQMEGIQHPEMEHSAI